MNELISNREVLSLLVGKRLSIWRRAANMLVVHFGSIKRSEDKSWGEYALHVQCPWRVLRDGVVFTGVGDMFRPARETDDFDWQAWWNDGDWPGNLMESLMQSILKGTDPTTRSIENATENFTVDAVRASSVGDASIAFSGGFTLDLFANSTNGEHWRILDFQNERHFVVESEKPLN